MASASFKIEGDLQVNIAQLDAKIKRGMVAGANYVKPQAISYMRTNAPWTDRTGAARNGLGAEVQVTGNSVALTMYHSVFYGVYLETRWGGKYSVIRGAIPVMANKLVETIGKLIFS